VFVPVHPNLPTSPFALELGQKLSGVVEEYRRTHPGMSRRDVRDAFRVAQTASGDGGWRRVLTTLVTVAIASGLFAEILGARWWRRGFHSTPWLAIVAAIIAAVILIRLARR
jgi:hypothetical protein